MKHKEDLRITKTKTALVKAFFGMLDTMEMDDITVNDLCISAGIRRATFYKHFKDKNDFVLFLIKDVRERFDNETWQNESDTTVTKEYYLKYAESVMNYLFGREVAIKNIINSSIRSTFIQTFVQQNYEDTIKRLEASKDSGMSLIASADVVASMLIGGISHCIVSWFEKDDRCTSDELLSDISSFIDRVLS